MGTSRPQFGGRILVLAISELLLASLILPETRDLSTCVLDTCPKVFLNVEFTLNAVFRSKQIQRLPQNLCYGFQKACGNARGLLNFFIEQRTLEFVLIEQDQAESFHFPQGSTVSYFSKDNSLNYFSPGKK